MDSVTVTAAETGMSLHSLWWNLWETVRWDVPKVVLVVLLAGFAWSLWRVQKRADFDLAEMYKDDNGKVSAFRFIAVGTWVAATWYTMQTMMDGVPDDYTFFVYVAVFSGAKVAEKMIEKWNGVMPWSK
jgi:hypothetical protein